MNMTLTELLRCTTQKSLTKDWEVFKAYSLSFLSIQINQISGLIPQFKEGISLKLVKMKVAAMIARLVLASRRERTSYLRK